MKFSRCKGSPVITIVTPIYRCIKDADGKGFEQDLPCLPDGGGILFI